MPNPNQTPRTYSPLLTLHVLSLSYERPCILSVYVCSISSPVFLSLWLIRITIYIYSTLFFAILATRSNTPFAFRTRIVGLDPLNSVTQTHRDDFESLRSSTLVPLGVLNRRCRYTLLTLLFVTIRYHISSSTPLLQRQLSSDWGVNVCVCWAPSLYRVS